MLAMMLCSRALGGMKINLYPSFCVRGIIDMPTLNSVLWMFILQYELDFLPQAKAIRSIRLGIGRVNKESLLLDPYDLPLTGPRDDVEAKLKSEIE